MYWFLSGNPLDAVPWLAVMLLWFSGGWLIAGYAFRLERAERMPVGFSIGLISYLFGSNLLGHFLPAVAAFSLSGAIVLLAGILFAVWTGSGLPRPARIHPKEFIRQEGQAWPWLVTGLFFLFMFLLISRGLAIFDEPKNLTLTSLMAQGDIPPHYYMNADFYFRYHYGFQLLPASLMRLGGMFPWSAFDTAKAIVFANALVLAGLVGKRFTGRRSGAALFLVVLLLGSGTRYLLLVLPGEWMASIDTQVKLVGTSATVGLPFSQALREGWSIQGGPPSAFPFAFINGIFPPLAMSHNGTYALSMLLLLLVLLLVPNQTRRGSSWVIAVTLAVWALTWESSYALFVIGLALAAGLVIWRQRLPLRAWFQTRLFDQLGLAVIASLILALIQGGVLTEIARGILLGAADTGIGVEGEVSGLGFGLRWPPAIITSHLEPLSLSNPLQLLVGLLELGPVFLMAPAITIWVLRRRRHNLPEQPVVETLLWSAWTGFLLPVFLIYQADRDITRFSGHALSAWVLFLAWMVLDRLEKARLWIRLVGFTSLGLAVLGGGVILAAEMSAVRSPVLGYALTGMDARLSRDFWGRLDEDLVFDPGLWRASAMIGIKTRAAVGNNPTIEWVSLYQEPIPAKLLVQGFRYVYIDDEWWASLSLDEQEALLAPCSRTLAEYWDAENEHFRRLVDLAGCVP